LIGRPATAPTTKSNHHDDVGAMTPRPLLPKITRS
jgi:hypothetical protein